MRSGRAARGKACLVFAGLTAALFLLLLSRSMNRPLNRDEHQFVAPVALLLRDGLLPYVDYAYFHMPSQVFLFAALSWWTSHTFLAARLIAVACGTGIAVLLFCIGWRLLRHLPPVERWLMVGGVMLALICGRLFTYTSGLAWNHETSTLCALAAVLLHLWGLARERPVAFLLSGLLLGGAVGIRLSHAPAAAAFLLSFWLRRPPLASRQRLVGTLLWCGGAVVGLLPVLILLVMAPAEFVFGNLDYPRLNTRLFEVAGRQPHMTTLGNLAFFAERFFRDPGDAVLLVLFVYFTGFVAWRARAWQGPQRNALWLVLGVLAFLLIGTAAPSPPQPQYAFALLPFMILAVFYAAASAPVPNRLPGWARAIAIVMIAIALSKAPKRYDYIVELPWLSHWTPFQQRALGERIAALTTPDALILTPAPIPALAGGLRVYPEFATGIFAWRMAPILNPLEHQRQRLVSPAELEALWARRPPDALLVTGGDGLVQPLVDLGRARGYRPVEMADQSYVIWLPRKLP